jgi:tyrosine-specific transport protein
MKMLHRSHHLVGATLLIAGTCIGVGMLALPVATAEVGFFASLPIYLIVWFFMLSMSRLIVEACLWCPKDSNLISISRTLLGTKGAVACWILYLFLFYCLMVAHTVAGGGAVAGFEGGTWPSWISTLLYVIVFAPAIYLGTRWVDRLNILLMTGVIVTFVVFFFDAIPSV